MDCFLTEVWMWMDPGCVCVCLCVRLTLDGQHGSQLSVQQLEPSLQIVLFLPAAGRERRKKKKKSHTDTKVHQYVND